MVSSGSLAAFRCGSWSLERNLRARAAREPPPFADAGVWPEFRGPNRPCAGRCHAGFRTTRRSSESGGPKAEQFVPDQEGLGPTAFGARSSGAWFTVSRVNPPCPPVHVALLRGINVSGAHRIPMRDLADVGTRLGWLDVRTLLQSGNVVFRAAGSPDALAEALQREIQSHFAFSIPVIVRTAAAFAKTCRAVPFDRELNADPAHVLMYLTQQPLRREAVGELAARASAGEVVRSAGGALWIHYPRGVAATKLTPAALDRAAGSPATGRNWNTVGKLLALAGA